MPRPGTRQLEQPARSQPHHHQQQQAQPIASYLSSTPHTLAEDSQSRFAGAPQPQFQNAQPGQGQAGQSTTSSSSIPEKSSLSTAGDYSDQEEMMLVDQEHMMIGHGGPPKKKRRRQALSCTGAFFSFLF